MWNSICITFNTRGYPFGYYSNIFFFGGVGVGGRGGGGGRIELEFCLNRR